MLIDEMLWMKDSDNITPEIRQCHDEGRDIDDLLDKAAYIQKMDDGFEKERAAEDLLLEMENRPVLPQFPYEEPDSWEEILETLPASEKSYGSLSGSLLRDKLNGAWTGRACGCLLGIPVEGWTRARIHGYLEESGQYPLQNYISSIAPQKIKDKYGVSDIPEHTSYDRQIVCWINNMTELPVDDDMNYTMLSLRVLERHGRDFTAEDVAKSWLFGMPAFHACTAERVAYRNLMHRYLPPISGMRLNPYREWIGAQIRVDFYGYINPGNPRMAAEMAYRDSIVAQTKNGVYAAMYIAAVISLAAVRKDYRYILREALKQIPLKSRFYEEVIGILNRYDSEEPSFEQLIDGIHEKYDETNTFDWCMAIPNVLIITASLLCFCEDYTKAIAAATLAGFDTDCNAATVGSIIGMNLGIQGIDTRWTTPVRQIFHSSIYGYEQAPVTELVERTMKFVAE